MPTSLSGQPFVILVETPKASTVAEVKAPFTRQMLIKSVVKVTASAGGGISAYSWADRRGHDAASFCRIHMPTICEGVLRPANFAAARSLFISTGVT